MRLRRVLAAGLGVALIGGLTVLARQPFAPLSQASLAAHTAALFRYGAIDVPQKLAGDLDATLLAQVASGAELSAADSARYRQSIQAVLAAHQTLFRALDNNLTFAVDFASLDPNNCGSNGIAGKHDLHAASAASNFAEMDADLRALATAGPIGRIYLANEAYKDLTDLMVHLAPATQSVVVAQAPALPLDADPARAADFETFRAAMRRASFAPINSPAYQAALTQALAAFTALAENVQAEVTAQLSPLEQRIAGRWLALQSVSPQLGLQ
jgi:hypothetical protein